MKYILLSILCMSFFSGCYNEEDYTDPNKLKVEDVITSLSTIQQLPLADGTTSIPIRVRVGRDAYDSTKVLVTTSKSTFIPAESNSVIIPLPLTMSNEREDTLQLKAANTAGTINIKASIGIYERTVSFNLENAPIESLSIEVPSLVIASSLHDTTEMEIKVLASRSTGKPSIGNEIDFNVFAQGNPNTSIGYFRNKNNNIDADRKCTYKYRLGPGVASGTVLVLQAKVPNTSISTTSTLIVYP